MGLTEKKSNNKIDVFTRQLQIASIEKTPQSRFCYEKKCGKSTIAADLSRIKCQHTTGSAIKILKIHRLAVLGLQALTWEGNEGKQESERSLKNRMSDRTWYRLCFS